MQRLWRVIIALFLLMLVSTSGLSMPGAQAATWPTEGVGSGGPNVVILQYLLQAHGYAVSVDGKFGPETQRAVELFQKTHELNPSGVVGSATWPRVIVQVQRGSTGSAVKALQYVLIAKYGYHLTVNGSFGSASYSSVADFQRKHGLGVDGIAGPITWNALIAGATTPAPTPVKTVPHTPTPVPVKVVAALTAVPSTVNRGGVLTVSGAGFAPNELVFIYFNALPKTVTPARATAAGLLPATGVTAPYSLPPGSHTLTALGITSKRTAHTTIVVQALAPAISLNATGVTPGTVVTVSGHGFGTHEQVTLSLNSAALTTNPTVVTTVNGAFTATFAVPSRLLDGPNTVSAIGNVSRVSAIATLNGTLPIASQFYFAGAVNTATEHSSVHILNTNGESASVRLTFFFGSGATDTKLIAVAAHAEKVVAVASLEPFTGPFGLDLQANRRISAQISIARDGQDGDTLLGNTGLGQTWYLAEGYTGLTFHESVSILNADFNAPAHVQLQLLPFGGRPSRTIAVTVPPHADYIADINSQMPNQSLSIIARSDIPVAVERTLTFSNNGFGMTTRAGTNTPATSWLFAEGTTTTRFQTFLTILNPNTTPALVTASFFGQTGGSLGSKTIEVAGLSRANLKLNDVLQASGVASVVTSNLPVVVERPEYFGSPNGAYVAGSDVFGRNGANASWTFPGGETASTSEFLLVYNPSPSPVTIAATLYGSDGNTVTKYVSVAPTVRATLNVNVLFAGLAPEHGIRLLATNGLGFVAEQTIFAPDYSTLESTEGSSS